MRALLRDQVESYEQLETLLLLASDPERSWDAERLGERVRISPDEASEVLAGLAGAGLLRRDARGGHRYAPSRPELGRVVARLAAVYAKVPLEVVKIMSTNSIERVRNAAFRTFSDAFLLRRKKRDG